MKKKEFRLWVSKLNQQRVNALKAELNAGSSNADKLLVQDDAVTHLFLVLQEYKKLKKDKLKNKTEEEN